MNSPMEPELTPRAAASTEAVTQALRRLTRAVWVLAALLALVLMVLGAAAWVIVRGFSNAQAMSTESSGREAATSPPAADSTPRPEIAISAFMPAAGMR